MDNKTIALVGALVVVGVAIAGMATGTLPGTETLGGNESQDNQLPPPPPDNGAGVGDGVPTNSGGGSGGTKTGNATGNTTANVTDTEPEPLPVVCEEQGSDFSSEDLDVVASDPLNTAKAEAMLHNRVNELRASRAEGMVNPLKCDPKLRKIARNHSKLVLIQEGFMGGDFITTDYKESRRRIRSLGGDLTIQENIGEITSDDVTINETAKRYEGVCDKPVETTGRYIWQKNIKGGSSGDYSFSGADFGSDQTLTRIEDEEDLVRDARRLFGVDNLDTITNPKMERQGIGIATDRQTGAIVITQVVCGPRNQAQSQDQSQ